MSVRVATWMDEPELGGLNLSCPPGGAGASGAWAAVGPAFTGSQRRPNPAMALGGCFQAFCALTLESPPKHQKALHAKR